MKGKKIIGRTEIIDLPELGLYNIEAKTDTGAETSVLHCEQMEVVKRKGHLYIIGHIRPNLESEQVLKLTFRYIGSGQ